MLSTTSSHPSFWCFPAWPNSVVSVAFKSNTPCAAQSSKFEGRSTGTPKSSARSLKMLRKDGGSSNKGSCAQRQTMGLTMPMVRVLAQDHASSGAVQVNACQICPRGGHTAS